jgi:hypothetical protein
MQSYYHSRIKDMNSVLIIGQPRFIFNHDPELSEREIIGTPWIGDTIRDFFKWIKSLFSKKTEDVAPTIEPPKETIKKFSSFSGCDIVVYKDGNVVGEIESISWYNPTQLEREQLHKSDYYDTDFEVTYKGNKIICYRKIFSKDGRKI